MTRKECLEVLNTVNGDIVFTYNGHIGGIVPFSTELYKTEFHGDLHEFHSFDELLHADIWDRKSLDEIIDIVDDLGVG
jgi:hypothetical protein